MAELKNIDDYLKGSVDLTKVDYLVVESGDANFFQVSGGAHFFGVDSTNKSIYKLWLDSTGKLVSEDAAGHKDVVAYVDSNKIQFVYGRHTDPYNGLAQPVTIPLKDGSDAQKELLVAFKGFASTWFNNLYVPRVEDISVNVAVAAPDVKLTSFSLDKTSISGKVGDTVTVNLINFVPSNATNKSVTSAVEDSTVAPFTNSGNAYTFTLAKEGTTAAHWVAKDGSGAKADISITVTAAE